MVCPGQARRSAGRGGSESGLVQSERLPLVVRMRCGCPIRLNWRGLSSEQACRPASCSAAPLGTYQIVQVAYERDEHCRMH
jgi:hypothetical protein